MCRGKSEGIGRDHVTKGFGSNWRLLSLSLENLWRLICMWVTVSAVHFRNILFRCSVRKGLEGDYCFDQRNHVLELLNTSLKRTGSSCFHLEPGWHTVRSSSHVGENQSATKDGPLVLHGSQHHCFPCGLPSWIFQPSRLQSQKTACAAGKPPSWAQSNHKITRRNKIQWPLEHHEFELLNCVGPQTCVCF